HLMRGYIHNYIEFSLDYALAGMFEEADAFLKLGFEDPENVYPMGYYFLGWYASQSGNDTKALEYLQKAATMNPDYCFPNRLEEVLALQTAMQLNPIDAKAPFYLGNFWYGARQYPEAISCWEKSKDLDDSFPTVHRNLSLAYYNKTNEPNRALFELEKAFNLDTSDSRILMELDQLYKKLQYPYAKRLTILERYPDCVDYRDDVYLERATLYNQLGEYKKALDLIMNRKFHPWEGGEGKVTGQYIYSLIGLTKKALKSGQFDEAISFLKATETYPHNLGEGKLFGAQENDVNYWMGCAYEGKGDLDTARLYWGKASAGLSEPSAAMFYNDQQPDKIFYQGLALLRLGRKNEASGRFNKLKDYGEKHIFDKVKIDYFAVSLPDLLIWDEDLNRRNEQHCHYLMGLGYLGLKQFDRAKQEFEKVLSMDINNQGAQIHLEMTM
ncbi:MAG: DUF5107 domain-containing protein, partial [Bacteroidota bacterium]|nr:DUF5107 domain-containing protein [Bacteroidota bacterium]